MFSSCFMLLVENRFKKFMISSVCGLKKDYLYKRCKIANNEIFKEDAFFHLKEDFNCHSDIMDELNNKKLYSALISLTEKQRFILSMTVIYGYSEIEVASRLNISQQRVSKVKNKILKKLRENIKE